MTSFWDHLYQYAQEHLVVRYLQEEPTGYGRLSIQTDARRRGLEDLLRGPAARSFRRLWEEQQELHSLEEQALFRAGREEFDRAAAELLAGNGPAELPRGVTEVTLYPAGEGRVQTVEFLCGGWGVGPSTSYWVGDQPCALRRPDRLPGGGAVGLGALGGRLALERGGGRQPLLCAQAGARVVLL